MKTTVLSAIALTMTFSASVLADEAAMLAQCVAEVTEKSAAAGEPAANPEAVCGCLQEAFAANPALEAEMQAAGGLPSAEEASPEMIAAIDGCKDAE